MKRSILVLLCSLLGFGLPAQTNAGNIMVSDFKTDCIKDLSKEPAAIGDIGDHISIGPSIAAQVLRYDLASKKAAFNTGAGAGFSVRWYEKTKIGDTEYGIQHIKAGCRADAIDAAYKTDMNKFYVGYLFAISPFVYVSKVEASNDLSIQPAIQLSFLSDLLTIGTGFNLTGTDKGHVFLLLSIGWGFKM